MQVHRCSDNLYRSFSSREEAVQAFNKFVEEHGDPSHNAETSTSYLVHLLQYPRMYVDTLNFVNSSSRSSIPRADISNSMMFTSKNLEIIIRQIPICMQQHLIGHVYFTAQLFHGNNAPWEVDVQGLRLSTGWVDFCEALDIKLEDEIVFQHMGFFKFQFFIFRNGERVAILDAQGDGIERNPHLEMLDLLWVNVKSSTPGTFALDILSECKPLLVTSYDLQYEPGIFYPSSTTLSLEMKVLMFSMGIDMHIFIVETTIIETHSNILNLSLRRTTLGFAEFFVL
nr:B3 domain-containing protein REM14-like [Ipomoea batatas]